MARKVNFSKWLLPEDQKETLNIWAGWNLINYLLDYWLFQNKSVVLLKKIPLAYTEKKLSCLLNKEMNGSNFAF